MRWILTALVAFLLYVPGATAQKFITRDIKSFGATGDGKTNDQQAFEQAAAFFNQRGGHGKLVITAGTYIVGGQVFGGGNKKALAYDGADVLPFTACTDLSITGEKGACLRYANGLKYGSFDPVTGSAHPQKSGRFINKAYAATLGFCISVTDCKGINISGLELDGNNKGILLGGVYGDNGRQLPHFGIFIRNSQDVTVDQVNVHHFGQDGICIGNKPMSGKDNIQVLNSNFDYNSRQGLSWTGGNSLVVKHCKFRNTGMGPFFSKPGAGIDIEAERGPVRNGVFEDCECTNNRGCGLVADSGDSGDCSFTNCTFWGTVTWSVWVSKPGFTFNNCNMYGSVVHGFDAQTDGDATRYTGCHFEDKPYNGQQPYGKFLAVSNQRRRQSFTNCTFISHVARLIWMQQPAEWSADEKYQFTNCSFTIANQNLAPKGYAAVIRGIRYKGCTFTFTTPGARANGNYINSCCGQMNVDLGGNKVIYQGG